MILAGWPIDETFPKSGVTSRSVAKVGQPAEEANEEPWI